MVEPINQPGQGDMPKLSDIEIAQITQGELAKLQADMGSQTADDFVRSNPEFSKFDLARLIKNNPKDPNALALELSISVRLQDETAKRLGFEVIEKSDDQTANEALKERLKSGKDMVLGLTASATRIAVSAEALGGKQGAGAYQRLAARDGEEGKAVSFDYASGVSVPNVPEIGKPFDFVEPDGAKTTTSPIVRLYVREQGQNSVRVANNASMRADVNAVASVRAPAVPK